MISFFEEDIVFTTYNKVRYKQWINKLAQKFNISFGTLNIIFCSDPYLLQINQKFLLHNEYTDVITFGYSIDNKKKISGDIFISIDTVKSNAVFYKAASFEQELIRVIAHGLLHLIGFNDHSDIETITMKKEEDIAILMYEQM
jgi:rRNA maturation RNase YbeY